MIKPIPLQIRNNLKIIPGVGNSVANDLYLLGIHDTEMVELERWSVPK